jgi:hypothetical protein
MMKGLRISLLQLTVITLALMIIVIPGCGKKLTPEDELTLGRVRKKIIPFIWDYSITNWQCPASYGDMIDEGLIPPINPYTGEPMIDTGTSEFDPETSPGNIHYVPVKDQAGMIGNYSVYVFGKHGIIRHIRPSPLAAD